MSLKTKSKPMDGASTGAGSASGQQPRSSNQAGAGAKPKPRFSSPAGSPASPSATSGNLPYPSSLNLSANGPSSRPSSRLSGTLSPAPAAPAAAPPPNAWAQKPNFASAARPSSAASVASNAGTVAAEPAPASSNGDAAAGAPEKPATPAPGQASPAAAQSPAPSPAPAATNGMPAQIAAAQSLLNSHVTIVTTKETYDGILTDLSRQIQQKGAARPHVILQKACIKGMKRDVMIREWQGAYDEIVSIAKWTLDPAEASPMPSAGAGKGRRSEGGFRTDADISRSAQLGQERVLVAWDAGSPPPASAGLQGGLDADTFGPSAGASGGASGGGKKGGWDQFAENERRFGTTTDFDEEMYTTKLVRNGEGFKDRERKAEAMAREIMGTASSNPHMQEERGQAVSSALGEEDRYSGVVRSANAYVPPSARKPSAGQMPPSQQAPATPAAPPVVVQRSNSPIMDPAVVRSSSGGPNAAKLSPAAPALTKAPSSGANEGRVDSPSADKSVLAAFQDFVKSDRQRLEQKKKLIDSKVKSEKDKKLKELMKFGQDFKLKTAIPQDLVPILAKDAEKQKAIVEKAAADALAAKSAPPPPTPSPKIRLAPSMASGVDFSTPQAQAPAKGRSSMVISDIPPFNPNKRHGALPAGSPAPPSPAASMASSTGARSMNAGAQPFVFKPMIPAFKPASGRSPVPIVREIPPFNGGTPKGTPKAGAASLASSPLLPKATVVGTPTPAAAASSAAATYPAAAGPVNPFFGTKVPKRSDVPVSVRVDFNPHRMSKLAMAPSYPPNWPYGARSFRAAFPPMFTAAEQHDGSGEHLMQPHLQQQQQQQHGLHPHHPQQGLVMGGPGGMQPHLVSPSMLHTQPQGMYGGPAYGAGGYYQPYRFAPQPGMPQGMSPNAAGGPSGSANGGNNAHGGGVYHQQQQPGGGFVPMFQPGGGPPGAAGGSPYGVQVMMLPQGGMYAAMPGYQGQPGQQQQPQMGGPPFAGGQANGGRAGGAGGPMGFYPMQQGLGGHPGQQQMQSPQMGHVYQPQFMAGGHMQPPPHFNGGGGGGQPPPPPQQQQSGGQQQQPSLGGGAEQQS